MTRGAAAWPRGPLWIAGLLGAIAALYWPTVRELAGLGERSDSQFALVAGAFLFMAWTARDSLERLPVRPSRAGLAALALVALLWLTGRIALVRLATDVAVVAMIPAAVLAFLGMAWVRALAFPLAFLVLAIPIEPLLAPTLAGWTADALGRLLELSGIAVQREGAYFSIASGRWAVADACSGLLYLTSCLVVSGFFAYLQFRSPLRRAAFIAGALALGIAGNWLRAYLTVLIAHLSDNRLLREDHSTFGWILYAVLFVAYFLAWWRHRDPPPELIPISDKKHPPARIGTFALLAAVVLLLPPLIALATASARRSASDDLSIAGANGWIRTTEAASSWTPSLRNPSFQRTYSFRKGGRRVDLFVARFRETWDSKLISFANRPGGPEEVLVRQWYWAGGRMTANPVHAKLAQLLERKSASAWIAISGGTAADLDAFMADMGPALREALAQTTVSSPR